MKLGPPVVECGFHTPGGNSFTFGTGVLMTNNFLRPPNNQTGIFKDQKRSAVLIWPPEIFRPKVPGDFRSWESLQTLPAIFIGAFEYVERFRNLKFAVKRITNIQSILPRSSEGTVAIHLAFK